MIPLPVEETQKSLFGLLSTGVIEYVAGQRRKRDAAAPAHPARDGAARRRSGRRTGHRPAAPGAVDPGRAADAPRRRAASQARRRRRGPDAPARGAAPAAAAGRLRAPARPEGEERRREIQEAWEGLDDAQPLRGARPRAQRERSRGEGGLLPAGQALPSRRPPRRLARRPARQARGRVHPARRGLRHAARPEAPGRVRGAARPLQARAARSPQRPRAGAAAEPEPPPPPTDPEEEARLAEEALRKAAKLLEQAKTLEQEKPDEPEHQRFTYDAIQLLEPVLDDAGGQVAPARPAPARARLLEEPQVGEARRGAAARRQPREPAGLGAVGAARRHLRRARAAHARALHVQEGARAEAGPRGGVHATWPRTPAAETEPPQDEGGGGLLGRLFRK